MSTSLTLVFEKNPTAFSEVILGFNRLQLDDQDDAFFKAIKDVSTPLGKGMRWYGEDGLDQIFEDAYGEPITYVNAHQLTRVLGPTSAHNWTDWDYAIYQMLRALPPSARIVLYWH